MCAVVFLDFTRLALEAMSMIYKYLLFSKELGEEATRVAGG